MFFNVTFVTMIQVLHKILAILIAFVILFCVKGAFLNVKINSGDLEDKTFVHNVSKKAAKIDEKTDKLEKEILEIVDSKI